MKENNKEKNLKTQLCNWLLENDMVKESDVILHSYSTSRMNKKFYTQNSSNRDLAPTLGTRCDCLGVVVKDERK